jgi:hypothetical protein
LQQKKKPADTYENWRRVFELIHGLRDLHLMSVVAAGNRHVLVPAKALPSTPLIVVEANAADYDALAMYRSGARPGTPRECEALRQSVVPRSAVLMERGGFFEGVRAVLPECAAQSHSGDAYFSFRDTSAG